MPRREAVRSVTNCQWTLSNVALYLTSRDFYENAEFVDDLLYTDSDSCSDLFWSGCLVSSSDRILYKLIILMILVTQIGAVGATQVKGERDLAAQRRTEPRRPEATGVTSTRHRICSMLLTILSCVSMTPFGSPVVPLLYGSAARSSAVS